MYRIYFVLFCNYTDYDLQGVLCVGCIYTRHGVQDVLCVGCSYIGNTCRVYFVYVVI